MEKLVVPSELTRLLKNAKRVVVLTGAGISAESGVPTFRDAQTGLWENYSAEELATPQAFQRNPSLVWQWYQQRRRMVSQAKPNPGHEALAKLQEMIEEVAIVTQNVDGLHHAAGSEEVIELHGNIMASRCFDHGHDFEYSVSDEEFWALDEPPTCDVCGSLVRPTVVWFGEALPLTALERAYELVSKADLVLSVGTSTLVQPAASLPFEALAAGVPVVEINLHPTPLSDQASFLLQGKSGEVLPVLVNSLS